MYPLQSPMAVEQQEESPFGLHSDSAVFDDEDDLVPISDHKYAQELQLQEALISSLIASQNTIEGSSSSPPILPFPSSSAPPPPPPPVIRFSSSATPPPSLPRYRFLSSSTPPPSPPTTVICEICAETKRCEQMFRNKRCDHSFCSDCITMQVATKIQENITVVACPALNCKGVLELDACRPVLPKELIDSWEHALCEALFLPDPKFYCPFRDCSAMLLVENEGEAISEAECPFCHRLFCARCYVPWHTGVECEVFQSLNEDERGREDLLVRELAGQKKWKRCPRCKHYVEKTVGCLHITCRCRFEFCYGCGEPWTNTHGGCHGI